VHAAKATRQQHVMFHLATLASIAETGAALVAKIGRDEAPDPQAEYLGLCARVNAGLAAQSAFVIANEILFGGGHWSPAEARAVLDSARFDYQGSQAGLITDMDLLRTQI